MFLATIDLLMPRKACILAAFLLLLALVAKPTWEGREQWNFGQFGDDGVYMVTAKSLAEGNGYRVVSLPGEPHAVKYPPLYPAYLSLAWQIQPKFPENLRVAAVMQAALLPFVLALMLAVLRQLGLSWIRCFWAAATTLVAPPMVLLNVVLFSELLFLCLLFAAILVIQRSQEQDHRWLALIGGLLTGLAYLTRNAALPMLAAAPVFYLIHKKPRLIGYFLLLAVPVSASWHLFTLTHGGVGATGTNASYLNEYVNIIRVTGFWPNFWKQIGAVSSSVAENLVPGIVTALFGIPLFHLILVAAITGNIRLAKRLNWPLYTIFAIPYLVMVLFWWFDGVARFILPIAPLLAAGITEETAHVLAMIKKPTIWRWATIVVGFLLVIRTANAAAHQVSELLTEDHKLRLEDLPAYIWIKDHPQPDTVALAWNDSTVYLYTGEKSSRGLFVSTMPLTPEYKAVQTPFTSLSPNFKQGRVVLLRSDLSESMRNAKTNPFQEAALALPQSKLEFESPGATIYGFQIPH